MATEIIRTNQIRRKEAGIRRKETGIEDALARGEGPGGRPLWRTHFEASSSILQVNPLFSVKIRLGTLLVVIGWQKRRVAEKASPDPVNKEIQP
jgi:hypothetical protein